MSHSYFVSTFRAVSSFFFLPACFEKEKLAWFFFIAPATNFHAKTNSLKFWHRCPKHGRIPKSNVKFWLEKIARNVRRDKRNRRDLAALGWTVWRVWEHDLRPGLSRRALHNLRRRFRRLEARLALLSITGDDGL